MSVATEFVVTVPVPARARVRATPVEPRLASVSVLRPPAAPGVVAPVRLTRRGVAVLALAVLAVSVALVLLAARSAPAEAGGQPAPAPAVVTVVAGDTLWSIAGRVAPERDPRAEVARLQRLNHLGGADLVPGQQLRTR